MSADFANSKLSRMVGGALLLATLLGAAWWWSIRIDHPVNPSGTSGITPKAQAPQLPGDKRLAAWAQQLQMHLMIHFKSGEIDIDKYAKFGQYLEPPMRRSLLMLPEIQLFDTHSSSARYPRDPT